MMKDLPGTLPSQMLIQERYRVVRQIGEGNMGAVYAAYDEHLSQTVALKQTRTGGEPFSRAFEREAKILAGLRHPVLPIVIDHFTNTHGQFMVMDFIAGDDLGTLLKKRGRPFLVDAVLLWADQVLHALEYLHRQTPPVIHRDIKPQNLKLTAEGQIVLLDFGLAKGKTLPSLEPRDYQRAPARARLSILARDKVSTEARNINTDIFGFTRQYAPLEQIQGTGTDPRSDLYALAATLYHLLTGTPPDDALKRINAMGYDNYSHYEVGMEALRQQVPATHPRAQDLHTYEHQLRDNIEQARLYGDNPTSQNERADLIDQLDALTRQVLDQSFTRLCKLHLPPSPPPPSPRADPLRPSHECNSLVPVAVGTVIHQALSLNPDDRPPSAAAMRDQLQAARRSLGSKGEHQQASPDPDTPSHDVFLPPHPSDPPRSRPSSPSPLQRKRVILPLLVIIVILIAQMTLMVMSRQSERGDPVPNADPTSQVVTPGPRQRMPRRPTPSPYLPSTVKPTSAG